MDLRTFVPVLMILSLVMVLVGCLIPMIAKRRWSGWLGIGIFFGGFVLFAYVSMLMVDSMA